MDFPLQQLQNFLETQQINKKKKGGGKADDMALSNWQHENIKHFDSDE